MRPFRRNTQGETRALMRQGAVWYPQQSPVQRRSDEPPPVMVVELFALWLHSVSTSTVVNISTHESEPS